LQTQNKVGKHVIVTPSNLIAWIYRQKQAQASSLRLLFSVLRGRPRPRISNQIQIKGRNVRPGESLRIHAYE
jgi:hypothetical protein